jgi:hypothetical protein
MIRPLLRLSLAFLTFILGACEHHEFGYGVSDVHPIDAKMNTEDCRECHGENLDGGTSRVSCDSCHLADWREDCTYCHGGEDSQNGAPPRDIDGTTDADDTSFWAHATHTTETDGPAYACTECHVERTTVTDAGHLFDDTPGRAEVDFSAGISEGAVWSNGSCTNAYCHGDGQETGDQELDGGDVVCGDCHAIASSGFAGIVQLSGEHREHFGHNVGCEVCHPNTDDGNDIENPTTHVDGEVTLDMPDVTVDDGRCSGSCHGENHQNEDW